MRRLKTAAVSCALLCALAGSAAGQTAAPVGKGAAKDLSAIKQLPLPRYRFTHASDGSVMRLDGETGKVVICKQLAAKWSCSEVEQPAELQPAQLKPAEGEEGNGNKIAEQLAELQKQLGMPEEERQAIRKDLAALREEIAALKQQVSALNRNTERDALAKLAAENAALKERLAALQIESATMQREIAELKPPPPPVPPAPVPAPKSSELKIPSEQELAQARALLADAWRRVVDMLNELRRDFTGKNEPPVRL